MEQQPDQKCKKLWSQQQRRQKRQQLNKEEVLQKNWIEVGSS